MNKKWRLRVTILIIALLTMVTSVSAKGSQEPKYDHLLSEGTPFPEARTIEDAVRLAFRSPDEWKYDPSVRTIYSVDAEVAYPFGLDQTTWRERLNPFEYFVLREGGTEEPFSNSMHESTARGIYYSRATGQPLFSSKDKYDSGTGWPSFTRPINPYAIVYIEDTVSFSGTEVVDSLSGSHLGHVFPDGPRPTRQRFCINSAALIFVPEGQQPPPLAAELETLVGRK